jgi:regulator of sigma E protease
MIPDPIPQLLQSVLQLLPFVLVLSLMMMVHELGHFITARRAGIVVQEFGFGLPPRIRGFSRGGVIYSINWIPFGAFVKMLGEEDPTEPGSFARKNKRTRAVVLAAGSGMNLLLAIVAFTIAYMTGWPSPVENEVEIRQVAPGTPAEQAGLREDDRVVLIAGRPITRVEDFRFITQEHLDRPMPLVVSREGRELQLVVTPRSSPPPGQGAVGVAIGSPTRSQPHPPLESLVFGVERSLVVVVQTLAAPVQVLRGVLAPDQVRPIGLPGMAQVTGEAAEATLSSGAWYPILAVTGIFSAGLAVANMLPIPALDGGRLLFVLIEAVRGRRVSPDRENMFHAVGIVVLITLMILISLNDIITPLPPVNWGPR